MIVPGYQRCFCKVFGRQSPAGGGEVGRCLSALADPVDAYATIYSRDAQTLDASQQHSLHGNVAVSGQ